MVTAIYAFSGDPITYGHIDIVKRAARAFERIVVGIGVNPGKNYTFSLTEREDMAKVALAHIPNAEVTTFEGLLVDYAYENGIEVIVKGVRTSADFDYENVLHLAGESQKLGIDTHVLFAKPELAHISSSMVKALQKEQGLVNEMVPLYVKQRLEERISGQYIVGITGEIGSGKSYIGSKLCELCNERGINSHNIELDDIGHQITNELSEKRYSAVRQEIVNGFGNEVRNDDGSINRKKLGEIVFNNNEELEKLNMIMQTPLIVRTRREMYGKRGLILFNAALIAESDMTYLCNNNVVLVYADKDSQFRRLKQRNLSEDQIRHRLESQYCFDEKRNKIEEAINRERSGRLWIVDNSDSSNPKVIGDTLDNIIMELSVK